MAFLIELVVEALAMITGAGLKSAFRERFMTPKPALVYILVIALGALTG